MSLRKAAPGVALLAIVALAWAATAAGRSVLVIRLKSVETSSTISDKPPKGISEGDVVRVRDNLFNRAPQFGKPTGGRIGSDQSTLTFLSASTAVVAGSATLPGGTVRFKGTVVSTSTQPVSLNVIGGTGKYAKATGTVTEPASDNNPEDATNTYRITIP